MRRMFPDILVFGMAAELSVLKSVTCVMVEDWCGNSREGQFTPCIDCCLWVESWRAKTDAAGVGRGRAECWCGRWCEWGIVGQGRIVVGLHVGSCPLGDGGRGAGPEGVPPGWHSDPWRGVAGRRGAHPWRWRGWLRWRGWTHCRCRGRGLCQVTWCRVVSGGRVCARPR